MPNATDIKNTLDLITWDRESGEVTLLVAHCLCIRTHAEVHGDEVHVDDEYRYVDEETDECFGPMQPFTYGLSKPVERFLSDKITR